MVSLPRSTSLLGLAVEAGDLFISICSKIQLQYLFVCLDAEESHLIWISIGWGLVRVQTQRTGLTGPKSNSTLRAIIARAIGQLVIIVLVNSNHPRVVLLCK
ncbi:pentatricopeptide repeat-containing protein [Pyrus ussuriensis x Pyrus communis]|uniref:Pentatricopeptide repeat-containing protein n=1 Tax=Pyrus ussuriensis x Pyrus communis TaxID=2448454 RepID=A0A5N5I6I2_9ROSA|nr:pentatricopeptide repeat-containing protein [Pyrus ussuriensis x Pyrus communis]